MEKISCKNILAINMKYYRYQVKLSQEKLAYSLGASLSYINNLENAKRNPSLETLEKISECFNITLAELLTYNKKHIINLSRVDQKNKNNKS